MSNINTKKNRNSFIYDFPFWLKKNLFNTPLNSIISIFIFTLIWKLFTILFSWLVIDSVWSGGAAACKQASGYCFPFLFEKARFIIFGFYPDGQLWRPFIAVALLIGTLIYSKEPRRWNKSIFYIWAVMFFLFF